MVDANRPQSGCETWMRLQRMLGGTSLLSLHGGWSVFFCFAHQHTSPNVLCFLVYIASWCLRGLLSLCFLEHLFMESNTLQLLMVGWGELTPIIAQHIMLLFQIDVGFAMGEGLDMDLVNNIAKLGCQGTNLANVSKNFWQRGKMPMNRLLESVQISVPLEQRQTGRWCEWMDFIDPHAFFSRIYHDYPQHFFGYIMPGEGVLKKFWSQVQGRSPPPLCVL